MPVVNDDFTSPDDTALDVHNAAWVFNDGDGTEAKIFSNRLEVQAFRKVVAYRNDSAEQRSKITTLATAGGESDLTGPCINCNGSNAGQLFFFKNNDGTYFTTIQIRGRDTGYIADVGLAASTYAIAASHELEIVEIANDGTDVTVECYIDGNLITTQVAINAVNTSGNDGLYCDRINENTVGLVDNFSTGTASTFSIDAEPVDIQPDDTALEITVSGQATTPTTGNSVVRLDGATGTVLNLTSVRDDTGGVYTLIFDAPAHSAMPDLAYDATGYTLHVTIDAETNETAEIPFIPPTGYGYVTLTDVTNSDLTALPALVASDQVEYELATSPDSWTVSISALGIITLSGGVNTIDGDTFDVRAWDSTDDTWGPFAEQTGTTSAPPTPPGDSSLFSDIITHNIISSNILSR